MRIVLISPRLAFQKGDFLGSGVPYWPLELAYLAGALREAGDEPFVFDLFGESPLCLDERSDHYLQGVSIEAHLTDPAFHQADAFVLFALSAMSVDEQLAITQSVTRAYPDRPFAVFENATAVTGYALDFRAKDFFEAGASFLIGGTTETNFPLIRRRLSGEPVKAPNLLDPETTPLHFENRLPAPAAQASLPVPAWDLFPVSAYWSLPYAHGPKRGRYFPLFASRGCPFGCDFCVLPELSQRRWRPRPPQEVVAEMLALHKRFGVSHFMIEDVNPTVKSTHWEAIAERLIESSVPLTFAFVSGTKAETIPLAQIPLLAQAGCRYLSISPESGDPTVLKAIGKKFDYEHGAALIAACAKNGIETQACFLVGHPAETKDTTALSEAYLKRLLARGLSEAAFFIVAPLPGSRIYKKGEIATTGQGMLSFSPALRRDYVQASRARRRLIRVFFLGKIKQGLSFPKQALRALFQRPATKMENLPWRVLVLMLALLRLKLRGFLLPASKN